MATKRKPLPPPADPPVDDAAGDAKPVTEPIPAVFLRYEKAETRAPGGFRPASRVLRYTAGPDDPMPGLTVDLRAIVFPAELQALQSRVYWVDILEFVSRYVVGWSARGVRLVERVIPATDEVPERTVQDPVDDLIDPPAVAGPAAFSAIATDDHVPVWTWIRACLIRSAYERPAEDGGAVAA